MKLRLISTASFILGASLSLAFGQGRPDHKGGERPDPTEMVKNLSERFASIAGYDANKDAKLDATELAAVEKAIEDGTLKTAPPGHKGEGPKGEGPKGEEPKGDEPKGEKPPAKDIAGHLSGMYEHVAAYDADKDGKLSETEQAAVVAAIKDGTLKLPRRGGPGGPGGRGGRGHGGGGRPDGPPPAQ